MGDNVTLINMKKYALDRLSTSNDQPVTSHQNGLINGGFHSYQNLMSVGKYQNGFIANKQYGDFDFATSPSQPKAPVMMSVPPRQPRSRPTSAKPNEKFIPENDIDIPEDGSLHEFSIDDMSTFLRYMGVEERIVTHAHKKSLDGAKFSKLKDSDLEALSMKNPIICHFRDQSMKKKSGGRKKQPFLVL